MTEHQLIHEPRRKRGDLVRVAQSHDDGGPWFEYGIVVQVWFNEEIHGYDTYVAFYGDALPAAGEALSGKPYVLRYAESSLESASEK